MVEDIKNSLGNLSKDNLVEVCEMTIIKKILFEQLCENLAKQKEILSQYCEKVNGASDTHFIKVVQQICEAPSGEAISDLLTQEQ